MLIMGTAIIGKLYRVDIVRYLCQGVSLIRYIM